MERCAISGFVTGIRVEQGLLNVEDTKLRDNTNGIEFSGGHAVIDHCSIRGDASAHGIGLQIYGDTRVTVMRSLMSGHDNAIYLRGAPGSAAPLLSLTDSVITHNRIGIYADRTGQVHLSRSTVTLNDDGLFTLNDGVIYTAGNNSILGNLVQNISGGANVRSFRLRHHRLAVVAAQPGCQIGSRSTSSLDPTWSRLAPVRGGFGRRGRRF